MTRRKLSVQDLNEMRYSDLKSLDPQKYGYENLVELLVDVAEIMPTIDEYLGMKNPSNTSKRNLFKTHRSKIRELVGVWRQRGIL